MGRLVAHRAARRYASGPLDDDVIGDGICLKGLPRVLTAILKAELPLWMSAVLLSRYGLRNRCHATRGEDDLVRQPCTDVIAGPRSGDELPDLVGIAWRERAVGKSFGRGVLCLLTLDAMEKNYQKVLALYHMHIILSQGGKKRV